VTPFEVELARIPHVLAVRTVLDVDGPGEVHVLASADRDVTEIVADVTSLAVLRGVELAPDDVHVVQLDGDPSDGRGASTNGTSHRAHHRDGGTRVELDSVMIVTTDAGARAVATARHGDVVATGTAAFVPASTAIRRGVAEATLAALLELAGAEEEIAVDAAVVISLPPNEVAIVTLVVVNGVAEQTLVGAVLVGPAGANDAIARAVLDATNRRFAGQELPHV
jgi:hypothetical protein